MSEVLAALDTAGTADAVAVRCGPDGEATIARGWTTSTVVDVASITKLAATTLVAARLVADGTLALDQPVPEALDLRGPGVDGVTLRHLLTHRSGHADWLPLMLWASDRNDALAAIAATSRPDPVATVTRYSDVGMMLAGAVVEAVAGASLDVLFTTHVAGPLALDASGYRPPSHLPLARCGAGNPAERLLIAQRHPELHGAAPAGGWRTATPPGEVDDANAHHGFGGVAGHAGLFASAADLARLGRALAAAVRDGDAPEGWHVPGWLPAQLLREWTTPGPDARFGIGAWTARRSGLADPTAEEGPGAGDAAHPDDHSFGHRGFTGCELLVDPDACRVAVLVSSRLIGSPTPRDHHRPWRAVRDWAGLGPLRRD